MKLVDPSRISLGWATMKPLLEEMLRFFCIPSLHPRHQQGILNDFTLCSAAANPHHVRCACFKDGSASLKISFGKRKESATNRRHNRSNA
ncbi:MAG: hypothetical protein EON56_02740 [Alphaproteobacteria bacterium]|nr:MAG: hypothetical protein EON56_02740 [Alphaproteobacteria bacterium]